MDHIVTSNKEIQRDEHRLTARLAPRKQLSSLSLWVLMFFLMAAQAYGAWRSHNNGPLIMFGLFALFNLFMATFTLLRWRDTLVLDRAANTILDNAKPVAALSDVRAITIKKVSGVFYPLFTLHDGRDLRIAQVVTAFGKSHEAEPFAWEVARFIGVPVEQSQP